jgi:hemerythrin
MFKNSRILAKIGGRKKTYARVPLLGTAKNTGRSQNRQCNFKRCVLTALAVSFLKALSRSAHKLLADLPVHIPKKRPYLHERMRMIINWDPQRMATGVPEVDAQHQEWVRRYNEFDEAVSRGMGLEVVRKTLDFFANYAETHFKLEEACMAEHNCPITETNRIDHERMRNILSGFKEYMEQKGVSLIQVIILEREMQEWLVKHILTIDIQLRDC